MFDNDKIKSNFSRAAKEYEARAHLQKIVRSDALELAHGYFAHNAKILDIGCGASPISANDWQVVGVDIAYGMCKEARKNNPNIINASATALPFSDAGFDGIFSSLMLQWLAKPEDAIREILRVLKPNCTAIITTFVDGTLQELKDAFTTLDNAPHISDFIRRDQLLMQVVHNGGTMLEVHEATHEQEIESVRELMQSIKIIGASNKSTTRKKGMMTKSQLERVELGYRSNIASWEVMTMVVGKA